MRTVLYSVLVIVGLVVVAWQLPLSNPLGPKSAAQFIAEGGLASNAVVMPARQFRVGDNVAVWSVMPGANLRAVRDTAVSKPFSDIVAQLSGGRPIFFQRGPFAVAVVTVGTDAVWVFERDYSGETKSELRTIARVRGGGEIDAKGFARAGGVFVVPEKVLLETASVEVSGNDQFHSLNFVQVVAHRNVDHVRDEPQFNVTRDRRQVFNGLAPIKFRFLVTGG